MVIEGWSDVVEHHDRSFVAGKWVPTGGDHLLTVVDPSTMQKIATVRESSEDDVAAAVEAATTAAPLLAAITATDRRAMLERLATELESRTDRLAAAISREMGMPVKHCAARQVAPAISAIRCTAKALESVPFHGATASAVVRAEPMGTVGIITPWSYPLLLAVRKLAPALAAGCPVVFKPSEFALLDSFILAEAVDQAGLPAGAFNLVLGTGPHVGESLVRDASVSMVSMTGSHRTGKRVAQLASYGVKRLILELGGQSPALVLDDADLPAAVAHCVRSVMINSGQSCLALRRLLVPFNRLADAEQLVAAEMSSYQVGASSDSATDVGPVANVNQYHHVTDHLERALLDGARTVWSHPVGDLPRAGRFVPPTAFVVNEPRIALAQEEVFGPMLALIPYVDHKDAVVIANTTRCGPHASVWSNDEDRALTVAAHLSMGTVDLNGAPIDPLTPLGAGTACAHSRTPAGILEFTQTKLIQLRPGAFS